MKVVQIIEALTRGGAERLVIELAREFDRRGVESQVVCLSSPGPWKGELDGSGLYAGCLGKRPGLDFTILAKLRKRIAELEPDVVQTHLFTANLWTRLAGLRRRDWVLVATLHNVDNWRGPIHILADRLLAGAADHYIGVSQAVSDYYVREGLPPDLIRTIPNGVGSNGAAHREALVREVPVIRSCGRLVAKKGFIVLIEAAAILKARGVRFRLEIAGEGPERRALEGAMDSLDLGGEVTLLGDRDDARELIGDADIFVLPSFIEGLPLVVLEALCAARPVVATDLPGLRGVVRDGEEGLVVPIGSAEAIAEAVERLIRHPDEARQLGRVGRARAKAEFSVERTAASYLDLYSQLLAKKAG